MYDVMHELGLSLFSSQKFLFQVKIPQLEVPLSTVDLSEFNVGASVLVYITYVLRPVI